MNRFIVALHEAANGAPLVQVIATRRTAHEAIKYARKHWPFGLVTYYDHMDANNNGLVVTFNIGAAGAAARVVTITDIYCLHARTLDLPMPFGTYQAAATIESPIANEAAANERHQAPRTIPKHIERARAAAPMNEADSRVWNMVMAVQALPMDASESDVAQVIARHEAAMDEAAHQAAPGTANEAAR